MRQYQSDENSDDEAINMLTVSLWDFCLSIENSDNEAINILTVSLWVSLWDLSFGPDERVDGLIVGPLSWAR